MTNEFEKINNVEEFLYVTTDPTNPQQLFEAEWFEVKSTLNLNDDQKQWAMFLLAIAFDRGACSPKMHNPYKNPKHKTYGFKEEE